MIYGEIVLATLLRHEKPLLGMFLNNTKEEKMMLFMHVTKEGLLTKPYKLHRSQVKRVERLPLH